jgi:hypothetical protein
MAAQHRAANLQCTQHATKHADGLQTISRNLLLLLAMAYADA